MIDRQEGEKHVGIAGVEGRGGGQVFELGQ